jgi:hypothetical protein
VFNNLTKPPKFLVVPDVSLVSAEVTTDAAVDFDFDERRALLATHALEETALLPADLGSSGYDVTPQPTKRK